MKKLSLLFLALLCAGAIAQTFRIDSVYTVRWDANTEANLIGYEWILTTTNAVPPGTGWNSHKTTSLTITNPVVPALIWLRAAGTNSLGTLYSDPVNALLYPVPSGISTPSGIAVTRQTTIVLTE